MSDASIPSRLVPAILLVLVAMPPAPAGAQGAFEGVITVALTMDGDRMTSTVWIKGAKRRMEMTMQGNRVTMIVEPSGRVLTLMDEQKQYHVMPVPPGGNDADVPVFQATGRRESVLGHTCEYHTIRDPDSPDVDGGQVCVAGGLGYLGFAGQGMADVGSTRAAAQAALRRQFPRGFTVLKALDRKGKVFYEVTAMERATVDDTRFAPPAGYRELRMPGG